MIKSKIRGKHFTMTTWNFKRLAIVLTADDEKFPQYGFCFSPRMSLNVFLGKRTLSFQPSDGILLKNIYGEEIKR